MGRDMRELRHYVERVGEGDRHVIEPTAALTGTVADEFDRVARKLLSQRGVQIRVDCRHLPYLDGEGLGVLLAARARANHLGGRLILDLRGNPGLRATFSRVAHLGAWFDDGDSDGGTAGMPAKKPPPLSPKKGRYAQPGPTSGDEA